VSKRDARIERIRAVEREHDTAVLAIRLLKRELRSHPAALATHGLSQADLRNIKDNME
jgi:hypothetical protein